LTGPAIAQQQVGEIKLGWVKSTANLAAFIAPELAPQFGLKIQSENLNTAVDISTALVNGQLDVGLLTPIHLIRAVESKLNLVQISGNVRGNTGIVIHKKHNIAAGDWAGLKALVKQKKLRIASSRGSINEMLAIAEFDLNGINVDKDLDLVNIANFGQHPQALRSGEFDIIVTLEPLVSLSVGEGTGVLFAAPYSSKAGDLNTNYVVRKDWLEKNEAKARAFVRTIVASANKLAASEKDNLDAAIRLTGLKPEIAKVALSNSRYNVANGLPQMQELARIAHARGLVPRDVSGELPQWVDGRFLKEAGVNP
jgi:ABC-type nitrate/sulfonate/bicarbonate transport system substrate-binding protein